MSGRWHWFQVGGTGLRHQLTVTLPMELLGLIDNLVGILTLGYVHSGLAMSWGFRDARFPPKTQEGTP